MRELSKVFLVLMFWTSQSYATTLVDYVSETIELAAAVRQGPNSCKDVESSNDAYGDVCQERRSDGKWKPFSYKACVCTRTNSSGKKEEFYYERDVIGSNACAQPLSHPKSEGWSCGETKLTIDGGAETSATQDEILCRAAEIGSKYACETGGLSCPEGCADNGCYQASKRSYDKGSFPRSRCCEVKFKKQCGEKDGSTRHSSGDDGVGGQ